VLLDYLFPTQLFAWWWIFFFVVFFVYLWGCKILTGKVQVVSIAEPYFCPSLV